jgi:anti-sigma factor RsiW
MSRMTCDRARGVLHEVLDGDLMDADLRSMLHAHLAGCQACREFEADTRQIQSALAALPMVSLSEEALDEVWNRTSRARAGSGGFSRRGFDWRVAAAAAVVTIGLVGTWWIGAPEPVGPTELELARAATEARMVLGMTANALRKTERATVEGVLADEVAPALRSVPIQWPGTSGNQRRNDDEDV